MLEILFKRVENTGDIQSFFYKVEVFLAVLFIAFAWRYRPKSPDSQFGVRESDLQKAKNKLKKNKKNGPDVLAHAKMNIQKPLQLGGIRIDGPAHQILGISPTADSAQIQKAYKELMKRFHPDMVGPQGSREWQDAQKIAEAIIRAKEEMLKKIKL